MLKDLTKKTIVAGAAVLAFGALAAGPAHASGWDVTDGTLTLSPSSNPPDDIELDLSQTNPEGCPSEVGDPNVSITFPSMGNVNVSISADGRVEGPISGDLYLAHLVSSGGSGTYTGSSSPYSFSVPMGFTVTFDRLFPADDPDNPCEVDVAGVCHWAIQSGTYSGTYTGSIPTPAIGDHVDNMSVSSPRLIAVSSCSPTELSAFHLGTADLQNLDAILT